MKRSLLAAGLISVGFSFSVAAQEKVTFPSTDADLRGSTATVLTGYLSRQKVMGRFQPWSLCMAATVSLAMTARLNRSMPYGARSVPGRLHRNRANSHGSRGQGNLCAVPAAERPILSNREVPRDVYGALSYLRGRPDVITEKIAILGQSAGGSAMMNAITPEMRPKDLSPAQDFHAAVALYQAACRL